MATALGATELAADPAYAIARDRSARRLELAVKLEPCFLERGTQGWAALFDETKVACSPVQDITKPASGPEGDAAHAFYAAAHRARPRAT